MIFPFVDVARPRLCFFPLSFIDILIEMDTLRTQRARKLSELFRNLREPSESVEGRIKLLHDISEALSGENSRQILEMESLFERERRLLLCDVDDESLDVLRQRQLTLFMDVIKDDYDDGGDDDGDMESRRGDLQQQASKCVIVMRAFGFSLSLFSINIIQCVDNDELTQHRSVTTISSSV